MDHIITHAAFSDPALTVALALAVGLVAQALARHLRVPGIVLLLATGAALGPDVLNVIRPQSIHDALHVLVGYAVAVILFEGGLNLNIDRLRHESVIIRRLVTIGALVTAVGGSVSAHYILDWKWDTAILFGTLVIVTGPTVISPLVRRIKLNRNLQTILEAEGVLIDPIGAIIAVVALEVVLQPSASSFAHGLLGIGLKLVVGAAIGGAVGFLIALLLRPRHLVPEGLENVLTLALVLAVFHVSDAVQPESGIVAVTAAGLIVGNVRTRALRDLMEFKEQLTVMFIGMLFVLLAADIRFADVQSLGFAGVLTVGVLMFGVRLLNIVACTAGSNLNWRERGFLAWLAPRGIVAAAVASFFADRLAEAGMPGGVELRAMTFLVIALTVLVQGLTGGPLASLLRVRRKATSGTVILGAHELGRALGRTLRDWGEEVLLIDSNADAINEAGADKLRVVFGNGLEEHIQQRAGLDSAAVAVGLTANEEVNQLFIKDAKEDFKVARLLTVEGGHVTRVMIANAGASVVFGCACDVGLWSTRLHRNWATVETWLRNRANSDAQSSERAIPEELEGALLPLVVRRGKTVTIVDESTTFREGDTAAFIIHTEKRREAANWLTEQGWIEAPASESDPSDTPQTKP